MGQQRIVGVACLMGGCIWLATSCAWADENASEAAMIARVDALLAESWEAAGLAPPRPASDSEFVRRAFLDLTGCIPRASETKRFLDSKASGRKEALVDELLQTQAHAKRLADIWTHDLVPDTDNFADFMRQEALRNWLRDQFWEGRRLDRTISAMLLVGEDELPMYFYLSAPVTPEAITTRTTESLLGLQLGCAQCHDHPFAKWKQEDFWGLAAFFADVRVTEQRNATVIKVVIEDHHRGELHLPGTQRTILPRYLRGETAHRQPDRTRRQQFTAWLVSPDNPYFARASVNRTWKMLFGEPLVKMLDAADPQHQLLTELAEHLIATDYDLRKLIGVLAKTKAYQASSRSAARPDERVFRMAIKSLTAEQLHDSLREVIEKPYSAGPRRGWGLAYDLGKMAFVTRVRTSSDDVRDYAGEVHQALTLLNGKRIAAATSWKKNALLESLTASDLANRELVEQLFLVTLSRTPTEVERAAFEAHLASAPTRRGQMLSDVLWALLNSAEFALIH